MLNLGCGGRFHPEWTNIDFYSSGGAVIAHDLNLGIPFPDSSFDVVYHSHVLEHFPKAKARRFIAECVRVLKPGGILRVVVPDLEDLGHDAHADRVALADVEVDDDLPHQDGFLPQRRTPRIVTGPGPPLYLGGDGLLGPLLRAQPWFP